MHKEKLTLIIFVLILVSMACSFNIDIPITTDIKTGETIVDIIEVEALNDVEAPPKITIGFGAGVMNLSDGGGDKIITGTATYNVVDFKPEISISNNDVKISTGDLNIDGIPSFNKNVENIWDLSFGAYPIDLTIKAGAYVGRFDLGGLLLNNLQISDGASEVEVDFSKPNLIEMNTLRYETGASNIVLKNLANANFDTMIFQSGAGDYELDFSGELKRDANIFIETGLSNIKILIPATTNVKLDIEGGLTNTIIRGNWVQSGDHYQIISDGPVLHIVLEMNAGNLILDNP